MLITSKDNNEIKRIKKLYEKKFRDQEGLFIIDGIKIIKEAIEEKQVINKIVICQELLEKNSQLIDKDFYLNIEKYDVIEVSESVFKSISEMQNPQGIIAIIKKDDKEDNIDYSNDLFLALDNIQDPGNIGTIIRTADSCNIKQIICSKETVDCYNSKVIRATMGAIFRVKIKYVNDLKQALKTFKSNKVKVLVTDLNKAKSIYEEDLRKSIIVIGNEANGVSKEILEIADGTIKIPMEGKTESLNAAVATGIIIYEAKRQLKFNK